MSDIDIETDGDTNSIRRFELLGPVGEKLFSPSCVSVSSTGEYLVSDSESCFIIIYSSHGEYLSHFSTIPKSSFYLLLNLDKYKPHDVAWLSSKRLVYTQPWGSKVTISNWNGKVSTSIEGKPLYQPYGVCVDNLDHIYITDREKGRILCYTPAGKLIKTYGGLGSLDGLSINTPFYIAVNKSGDIIFNDSIKDVICIKLLNTKVGIHKTISTNIQLAACKHIMNCLTLDLMDNILITDNTSKSIQIFTSNQVNGFSNETFDIVNINKLSGITFNQEGNLVCIDQQDKLIKILPWANRDHHIYCNGHVKSSLDIYNDSN